MSHALEMCISCGLVLRTGHRDAQNPDDRLAIRPHVHWIGEDGHSKVRTPLGRLMNRTICLSCLAREGKALYCSDWERGYWIEWSKVAEFVGGKYAVRGAMNLPLLLADDRTYGQLLITLEERFAAQMKAVDAWGL